MRNSVRKTRTTPGAEQAECLRGLERAEAVHAAPGARVLAAFCSGTYVGHLRGMGRGPGDRRKHKMKGSRAG